MTALSRLSQHHIRSVVCVTTAATLFLLTLRNRSGNLPFNNVKMSDPRLDVALLKKLQANLNEQFTTPNKCSTSGVMVTICYHTYGDSKNPCILLVPGLNGQSVAWDDHLVDMLVQRGPYYVVRYDNRDAGLSTKMTQCGSPQIATLLLPQWVCKLWGEKVAYTMSDMAADGIHLLDHLKVEKAHVVGVSMGGMIAQTMAIEYPSRVASLTSMMSTTGSPQRVNPSLSAKLYLLHKPKGDTPKALTEFRLDWIKRMGGPRKFDEVRLYTRAYYAALRTTFRDGSRQTFAIARAPCRLDGLRKLQIPCLVLHGAKDELIPVENGYQTAAAIPHCRLVVVPEMGHMTYVEDHAFITEELDSLIRRSTGSTLVS